MIEELLKLWDKYGFHLMFFGGLILIIILYFVKDSRNASFGTLKVSINTGGFGKRSKSKRKKGAESRGESICRSHLEKVFGKKFPKRRPSFLKNPKTGRNLELDMYNPDMKLALEYNGSQHYYFSPWYHRNQKGFEDQKFRDNYKKSVCEKEKIDLIIVPYSIESKDDIETYINRELKRLNYL